MVKMTGQNAIWVGPTYAEVAENLSLKRQYLADGNAQFVMSFQVWKRQRNQPNPKPPETVIRPGFLEAVEFFRTNPFKGDIRVQRDIEIILEKYYSGQFIKKKRQGLLMWEANKMREKLQSKKPRNKITRGY